MYGITNIDVLLQGRLDNMKATKKCKLSVKVQQIDGSEIEHTLWLVECCKMVGVNLFVWTCKLLYETTLRSECKNIITNQKGKLCV